MRKKIFILIIYAFSIEARASYIEEYLRDFHAHPQEVMNRLPDEIRDGRTLRRYPLLRLEGRIQPFAMTPENMSLGTMLDKDPSQEAKKLIYSEHIENNLQHIDQMHLSSGTTNVSLWSDSYWPIYKGLLGVRYADKNFPQSKTWQNNYDYYLATPSQNYIPDRVDELSPAEKYDLLVDDTDWSLTQSMWNEGLKRVQDSGYVARWQGICHGWSAAAHMDSPPPLKDIVVTSSTGIPIHFYQSDLKALLSYLWANSSPPSRLLGTKCLVNDPEKDNYGRIIEPSCLDVNPATWHLAIVNHVGVEKFSMVMDGTFDAEIWNYPIASYKFAYFNPQTFQGTHDWRTAKILSDEYKLDKFKVYRNPRTVAIIGIQMDVKYAIETEPSTVMSVNPAYKTIRYVYDLELDSRDQIIDGEWYTNGHPDFIWTFEQNAKARSPGDGRIGDISEWSDEASPPATWAAAARGDAKNGRVLEKIVTKLVELSRAAF